MESMQGVLVRAIAMTLAVHLVIWLAGFVVFGFVLNPDTSVNPDYINALSGAGIDMSGGYQKASAGAITVLQVWWAGALGISFAVSSAWLVLANLKHPQTPLDSRSALVPWLGFFILGAGIVGSFGFYYLMMQRDTQLQALAVMLANAHKVRPELLVEAIAAAIIGSVLAYYTGTLLGVKRSMRASVPFANSILR